MKYTVLLASLLLLHTGVTLAAQSWSEVGDAGRTLRTAQVPVGYGPLTSISGNAADGIDLFALQIDDPAAFTASTVGGASWDTLLCLFDEQGYGITIKDDDVQQVLYQTTITGQFVPAPGRYYLSISSYSMMPIAFDYNLWNSGSAAIERRPDGPRRTEAMSDFAGAIGNTGPYTITLTGCSFPAKRIVLPDTHHLSESSNVLGSTGSVSWWRNTSGRFQVIYDASHFLDAGSNGPITIKKLMFRGEDGEAHRGGAQWSNVVVQLGATSLTPAGMSTTYATNRSLATTTLGIAATTTVTQLASIGSTPNNDNIIIDLDALGIAMPFDPTGARPNLLVDISYASAPTIPSSTGAVQSVQDTTGTVAQVRGRGVTTATVPGTTGVDAAAPVIAIEVTGTGGNRIVVPARNEYYGAGSGGQPSAFYQSFLNGQRADVRHLRLTPDSVAAPTFYNVAQGPTNVDAAKVNATPDSTADDAVVAHALGFTFRFPGGSTTSIRASTNGFVWLDGVTTDADFSPTVAELLGGGGQAPRLAPFWTDLHCGRNTATRPNSGLHVLTDASGGPGNNKCYITWLDVAVFNSGTAAETSVVRVQCVLGEDGSVEFRYASLPRFCGMSTTDGTAALVGFARGSIGGVPSVDPGSRDLSFEVPFATSPEGTRGNLIQTAVTTPVTGSGAYGGRAFAGQTLSWNVANVPPGSTLGVQLLDVAPSRPGFQLPGITAPGCRLSTTNNALLWELHLLPPPNITGSRQLVIPPGVDGFELYAQYVVLDGLFGAPNLITASSNAVRHVVGRQ